MRSLIACLLLALFPALWWQYLAGDTLIHLVFAETAASGRFFEYNPGELCAGETSPGYMLLLAGIHALLGSSAAVVSVKATGFSCWYALLFVVFRLARAVCSRTWAWAIVLAVGLMPGSVANAVLGMENVVFALWLWLWLWWALRKQWFSGAKGGGAAEFAFGLAIGAAIWIRPEALPFAVVAAAVRATYLRSLPPALWFLAGTALAAASLWVFTYVALGHSPYGAGVARVQLSADLWLGRVPLSFKFGTRLLAYGCISFPAVLSVWVSVARLLRRTPSEVGAGGGDGNALLDHLAVQLLVAVVLFSTVFPSVHLARYTLFVWPMLALHAARGLQLLAARMSPRLAQCGGVALACTLLLVYAFETHARLGMARGHALNEVLAGPSNRVARTDRLLADVRAPSPSIVVGVVEVQLRYFVDERVTVRSLDGLLDERMAQFTHDGQLDSVGYLESRKVDYLLDHPDFLSTRAFSYASLDAMPIGSQTTLGGLLFTRVAQDVTRISAAPSGG